MSNGEHDNPLIPKSIAVGQPVGVTPATVDKANPYGVAVTAGSETAAQQAEPSRYQTFRTGLVLIVASHFGHISMVLLMMYIVFTMMNFGSTIGGAVGDSQGAEVGGEIGGTIGSIFATCCAWVFFIVTAPLNFIGGCLGFSVPDITGAKSKIAISVIASALAILCWVAPLIIPQIRIYESATIFFTYIAFVLFSVFVSHLFFIWAMHEIGQYLGNRDVCTNGFATVALCGLCFLLVLSGLGILMQLDGWKDSAIPGSSSGMWLLSGVFALVWLGMYIRLLLVAMNALKSVGSGPMLARPAMQSPPVQPFQSGIPVAQSSHRKGW